jgi:hypothetical protein
MHRFSSGASIKDEDTPKKEIKRTFSNNVIKLPQQENNNIMTTIHAQVLPPKPTQKKLNQSKGPGSLIQNQNQVGSTPNNASDTNNPILNFLFGSMFHEQ